MNKLSLASLVLILLIGCHSTPPEHQVSSIAPITSSQLLQYMGSGFYTPVLNGQEIAEVLAALKQPGIIDEVVWKDGIRQLNLEPAPAGWKLRWDYAVLDGKIIGTVVEVNEAR